MRILLVNTFYEPNIIGGAEISVQKLAEALVDKGHDVSVLCTGRQDSSELINQVKVIRISINNVYQPLESKYQGKIKKLVYRLLDLNNLFNKNKFQSIIKKISPDVIHINNIYGLSPVIWKVANEMNIPIVQTLRDYYLMCPMADLLKRKQNEVCNTTPRMICKMYRSLNKKLSEKIDYVTAPSQFTLDLFIQAGYFKNCKKKKIFNAIDFDIGVVEKWYEQKKKNLIKKEIVKFIYLGALDEHKGVEVLLKAFHKVKDKNIELHIAGRGHLESLVYQYIKQDNRIKYHGFINGEQKEQLLLESDVLIVPSIWYEPFGRVVIDAYKYGMPVIGTSMGGIKEIINHEKTGLLIKPNDIMELVNAIEYFTIKENIHHKLEHCLNNLKQFSIEEQIKQFEEIYEVLIRCKG